MVFAIAQQVVDVVRNVPAMIAAGAQLAVHVVAHLPQYLSMVLRGVATGLLFGVEAGVFLFKHIPDLLRFGFNAGRFILQGLWDALKYTLTHIPEILKGIYDLAYVLVTHLPEVLRTLAEGLYHLAAWVGRHSIELVSNTIGIGLGLLIAPFQLGWEQLTTLNTAPTNAVSATSTNNQQVVDACLCQRPKPVTFTGAQAQNDVAAKQEPVIKQENSTLHRLS